MLKEITDLSNDPTAMDPAFPIHPRTQVMGHGFTGMTLRQYIAAHALAGTATLLTTVTVEEAAKNAVLIADALIAELEKETK